MTNEIKTRRCMKCRQEKQENNFVATPSKFFPGHRSMICTNCLETMIDQADFNSVDGLMRYLDLPFDLDQWTRLYENYTDHTLTAYFQTLEENSRYNATSWADENERWRMARESNTIDNEIAAIRKSEAKRLRKVWAPSYSDDELLFLEDFYN